MNTQRAVAGFLVGGGILALLLVIGTHASLTALLAHACGLLAGYAAAVLVVLMARVPWLERVVGTGTLAHWHRTAARAFLVLVLVHVIAATSLWWQDMRELTHVTGVVAALVGTAILVLVGATSARAARRRISHETWRLLHLLTYLAVLLGFLHQLAGPDLAGRRPLQIGWALLYCYVFAAVVRYRIIEPVRMVLRHRMIVSTVRPEGPDVVSIVLQGRHLDELAARPGQFFRWRFLVAGLWRTAHPFSLSAPVRDGTMRVTVKALGDGTRRLHALHPGVRVLAAGPYGRVPLRTGRPALLIAGGIGITPARALFETTTAPGITLLYRASCDADVLFRDELDEIAEQRGARIVYLVGPSSEPGNAMTADALLRHVPDLHQHEIFVCASARLTTAVRAALREAGVLRENVHVESLAL